MRYVRRNSPLAFRLADGRWHPFLGAVPHPCPLVPAGAVGSDPDFRGHRFRLHDEHAPSVDEEVIDLAGSCLAGLFRLLGVAQAQIVQYVHLCIVGKVPIQVVRQSPNNADWQVILSILSAYASCTTSSCRRFELSPLRVVAARVRPAVAQRERRESNREEQTMTRYAVLSVILLAGCGALSEMTTAPETATERGVTTATEGPEETPRTEEISTGFEAEAPDSAGLSADERAWIERSCPRGVIGPAHWKRCAERDLQALTAGTSSRAPTATAGLPSTRDAGAEVTRAQPVPATGED